MNTGSLAVQERFWGKVDKKGPDECWLWTSKLTKAGYGDFWDGTRRKGGSNHIVRAHRFSYELLVGPIPNGLSIDHICRVRSCVNPRHLRPATMKQQSENRGAFWGASGVRGVSLEHRGKTWRVRVMHAGRAIYGGAYDDIRDAERAAIELRNGLFTHNNSDRVA